MPTKFNLALLPTRLYHSTALDRFFGFELWLKRDDESASGAAGDKIRKLEYLLFDAREKRATTLVTCGGQQSNHARATALLGAELGFRTRLLLRTADPQKPPPLAGNLLLDRMAGAEIQFITPEQYRDRDVLMREAADELAARGERPYVIPEGGSNGLGALGYVDAMGEVREQLAKGLGGGRRFDAVIHACGSGGTAAGVALGVRRFDIADTVHAMAVCDDTAYFQGVVRRIVTEAASFDRDLDPEAMPEIHDAWKGPAYAVATEEQLRFLIEVAQATGLLFDPVYTGKALFGLSRLEPKPRRALFIHTGGIPGLLAQAEAFAPLLDG